MQLFLDFVLPIVAFLDIFTHEDLEHPTASPLQHVEDFLGGALVPGLVT